MVRSALVFLLAALFSLPLYAQVISVQGRVADKVTGAGIADAVIAVGDMAFGTRADGSFVIRLNLEMDRELTISMVGYNPRVVPIAKDVSKSIELGDITLTKGSDRTQTEELIQDIPVIELTESDFDENAAGNVSGLLQAARDPFVSAAAFQFSAARFRIRGYESRYTTVLLNGVSANDPGNGDVFWSEWAGLNDVMRAQENQVGLSFQGESIANIGGITTFDTRAHRQRKQIRAGYATSNRTYRNRAMVTWSTGWLKHDWAVSVSGSRRWGQEGYIPGTHFDGWSYFLSVDKRLAKNHLLNLTVLGAPVNRGRSIANTKEQNEIAGTNYYNPYWGKQEGEVRNSRVVDAHQPIAILRYDWQMDASSNLMASFSWQDGKYGSSALEWADARDPRPEYYRRWPSSMDDPASAAQVKEALMNDESLRQVDWTYLYNTNYNSPATIQNVDGIAGNSISGLRSKYMLQEYRSDARTLQGRVVYMKSLNNRHLISAGLQGQQLQTDYFKSVLDLLGGDFWLDIDRFAEFDFPNNPEVLQNDLDRPNHLVREGDKFGYDYQIRSQNYQGWAQANFTGSRMDGFIGAELGMTSFYRLGNTHNGRFPENSQGKSEVLDFLTWAGKGGLTYKINGRNYITGAVFAAANAPDFTNAFVSPRTRDQVVPDISTEKVFSGELTYRLQAPNFKFRATGYLTEIRDQTDVITFFNDLENTFGNYILSGLNRRHIGTEWGAEWKLTPSVVINGAAALGQYYYTDRALASVIQDNTGEYVYQDRTVYIKNFHMDGMPQEAFSLGVTYNSRKFWFANIQLNYFRKSFLDFSPDRRTAAAVVGVEQGSEQWHAILDQEELPAGFMLNVFGGKSWKIKDTYLYLNVGVNNILNNTDFITGGFEQLRFDDESRDVSRFPNRYFYAFGLNYFINFSVRI
ncbi:MAG: TonB-dependent receptor plug domain-containing protein [Saprospiraceae bacterium]|nr:TonB-dependent receptor plug domain-containing protein [Saprospiraceae bacterium]